jgi:hypothetical protein
MVSSSHYSSFPSVISASVITEMQNLAGTVQWFQAALLCHPAAPLWRLSCRDPRVPHTSQIHFFFLIFLFSVENTPVQLFGDYDEFQAYGTVKKLYRDHLMLHFQKIPSTKLRP